MDGLKIVKVVSVVPKTLRIERPDMSGSLALYIGAFEFMRLGYDHRYTSNAGQYAFAEKIARGMMLDGDTLIIDGRDCTKAVPATETKEPTSRLQALEKIGVNLGIAIQALKIVAGEQQCIDNLMSNDDVARDALRMIRATEI